MHGNSSYLSKNKEDFENKIQNDIKEEILPKIDVMCIIWHRIFVLVTRVYRVGNIRVAVGHVFCAMRGQHWV